MISGLVLKYLKGSFLLINKKISEIHENRILIWQHRFADDFNRDYGGNKRLYVQKGNLMLDGQTLIGAEKSRIKTLCLPELTIMGGGCLENANALTIFEAPALTAMGDECLWSADALTSFEAPALATMGDGCLQNAHALTSFEVPAMGEGHIPHHLKHFSQDQDSGISGSLPTLD